MNRVIYSVYLSIGLAAIVQAADWPTYRAHAARTGYTSEQLPADLSLRWTYEARHKPDPAWPRSKWMTLDRSDQPIVAGGKLFFGNSVDGKLYALDAKSGRTLWTFYTGGPIRFAPVGWKNQVLVASDDGHLYALNASDGGLLWKHRGGRDGSMCLGNEHMIAKWPARGGPVVVDDKVYYASGIWPSEGIFVYALDAQSGRVEWVNNDSGGLHMPQPHSSAFASSGISAQGYLIVMADQLFVPTGRAVPAAFDRTTGKFQYFRLQENNQNGGRFALAARQYLYNGGIIYDGKTGAPRGGIQGLIAATPEGIISAISNSVAAYDWGEVQWKKRGRRGVPVDVRPLEKRWGFDGVRSGAALIVAGDAIISGSDGQVDIFDAKAGEIRQSIQVAGAAYGLAVADARLYVATDQGKIYCFDGENTSKTIDLAANTETAPYGGNTDYAQAAKEILRQYGSAEGYCLDIGCGNGALAFELAKRSKLYVCAIESDAAQVAEARHRLDAAGLLGSRVVVHHMELNESSYPKYFANLVVSGRSITEGPGVVPEVATERMLQPYGGIACVGAPDAMKVTVRGELPGAGSWTHCYANAANTVCSDDQLFQGPLGVLWFRDIDLELVQRHGRGPPPLCHHGRIVHAGLNEIRAVDAYNGRELWRYSHPGLLQAYEGDHYLGVSTTGSNCCLSDDSVYVRNEDYCLRIDAASGKLLGRFTVPAVAGDDRGPWGYIACHGDLLFGTTANPEHVVTYRYRDGGDLKKQLTESSVLFALDAKSGRLKWKYKAKHSIRHNAIAIGAGQVYLIDRPLAEFDREKRPHWRAWRQQAAFKGKQPTGDLLALDTASGKVVWEQSTDIYGTSLALSDKQQTLVMAYQIVEEHLDSEIGGRMNGYDTSTGELNWSTEANYASRLILNDRTIYAGGAGSPPYENGGAWDLVTGAEKPCNLQRSYGCGIFTSCRDMIFCRSSSLGYFDLRENQSIKNYGGVRLGCWINAIPAGGVLLVPDGATGCKCSHVIRTWLALEPLGNR